MTPGELLGWRDFFVASAGAAATLAGLLFVAVSINLARVLEFPNLPIRALETLVALLSILMVATMGLIPLQSGIVCGFEISVISIMAWAIQTTALVRSRKADHLDNRNLGRILTNQLPPLPFLVAGVLLACGDSKGIYWVVPGIVLSYLSGVIGAWVLLVEIQR